MILMKIGESTDFIIDFFEMMKIEKTNLKHERIEYLEYERTIEGLDYPKKYSLELKKICVPMIIENKNGFVNKLDVKLNLLKSLTEIMETTPIKYYNPEWEMKDENLYFYCY